ncbi:MAG: Fructokinase [Phycisphaerae bacterium]|nr:Fructokinase [Phycisphaerae bacterium]
MEVYCFGELLLDLLATGDGLGLEQAASFTRAPGGAPANVARDLATLGVPVRFAGLLGDDPFGRYLSADLADAGVDCSWLRSSGRISTPLAFLATPRRGPREVSFTGMDSWASALAGLADIDHAITPGPGRWLHVGGVASAWPDLHHRQRALVTRARRAGWVISLDVNYRPALYQNRADLFAGRINELLPLADVVKVSVEELAATLPGADAGDLEAAADRLVAMGPTVVAVTRGAEGSLVKARGRSAQRLAATPVNAVESTGAGDAFMAGLIAGLGIAGKAGGWPTDAELAFAVGLAGECGALAVTQVGAAISLKRSPGKVYPMLAQWKKDHKANAE